jgi:hypothetical protein
VNVLLLLVEVDQCSHFRTFSYYRVRICSLFNDAFSVTQYNVPSNEGVMSE